LTNCATTIWGKNRASPGPWLIAKAIHPFPTESLRPLANNPPATPNLACHRRQRPPSGNTKNDPGTHYLAV
jgi:hypothetical protein